jgi:hypothetical protein
VSGSPAPIGTRVLPPPFPFPPPAPHTCSLSRARGEGSAARRVAVQDAQPPPAPPPVSPHLADLSVGVVRPLGHAGHVVEHGGAGRGVRGGGRREEGPTGEGGVDGWFLRRGSPRVRRCHTPRAGRVCVKIGECGPRTARGGATARGGGGDAARAKRVRGLPAKNRLNSSPVSLRPHPTRAPRPTQ